MFGDHFFVEVVQGIGEPCVFKEFIFFLLLEFEDGRLLWPPDVVQIYCRNQIPGVVSGFVLTKSIIYVKLTYFLLLQNIEIVWNSFLVLRKFSYKHVISLAHQVLLELFPYHIFQLCRHFFINSVNFSSFQDPVFSPKNLLLMTFNQRISFCDVFIFDIRPKTYPEVFFQ